MFAGQKRIRPLGTALTALLALVAAACGGAGGSSGTSTQASSYMTTATAHVQTDYKSTNSAPDSTSRPAVKGKKIVVISAGDEGQSASIPVHAALDAAKALGWSAVEYDEHLDPTKGPALMRQAIAAGVDGIVLDANDCPLVKAPLQEARAKNIVVIPIYAFDCNDPIFGAGGSPLFNSYINFGRLANNPDALSEEYGANQADAVIVATNGHARVVFFNDNEFTVLSYTGKGFKDELAKCPDCKIVDEVDFKAAELGPTLQQKAASALLQHPEATAVKIPYEAATVLGISAAVVQSGRSDKLYVMGGEGFPDELDLIRQKKGVSAVNIISSEWTGWAAVDTMNSMFQNKPAANSGIGWALADSGHNLPPSGPFVPSVDFKAAYLKAWGV
jgi:ribose transport system substrate-binding protein